MYMYIPPVNHHIPSEIVIERVVFSRSKPLGELPARQVPKPFNPEKEFQKRQLRIREKIAAMQKATTPGPQKWLGFYCSMGIDPQKHHEKMVLHGFGGNEIMKSQLLMSLGGLDIMV